MIGFVLPLVAFFSSFAMMFISGNNFSNSFLFTWLITLYSIIGLWFFHRVIGMGYLWFGKGTILGVKSYAAMAHNYLCKKNTKGILYLKKSLFLLDNLLTYEELRLPKIENVRIAVTCFLRLKCDIPFEMLQNLSMNLRDFKSIQDLQNFFDNFVGNQKVKWTDQFKEIRKSRQTPVSQNVLKLVTAFAAILSGLAFLPETTRDEMFVMLQSLGSVSNLLIIVGGILLLFVLYISSLIEPYRLSPFKVARLKRLDKNAK